MPFGFALELIDAAAIGAFDAAVVGNGQEHAGVAVPGFVVGAAAMQGQVVRGEESEAEILDGAWCFLEWAAGPDEMLCRNYTEGEG